MTKEERTALKAEVLACKAEKKRIHKLPAEERKAAQEALKEDRRQRKAAIKAMPKEEKRQAKRHDRRMKHRLHPVRRVLFWVGMLLLAVIACALVFAWLMVGSLAVRALTAGFDLNSAEAVAAQTVSRQAVEDIEAEGIVLLQNKNDLLPLLDAGKINVFGSSAVKSVFGGGGSGSADTSHAVTMQMGLENAGFTWNPTLLNLYSNWVNSGVISTEDADKVDTSQARGLEQTVSANYDSNELPVEGLTSAIMDEAKAFSDIAVVVIGRTGSEGTDLSYDYLKLSQNERDMVDTVCASFDHVVVLLNTCNPMELGWIEEHPQIESVLWIGPVGNTGMNAVGRVLNGTVNPSGRTVDTYAYDLMSNPANIMIGSQQWSQGYRYDNLNDTFFINYYEGIYVGYRYYETRYMDDEAGYQAAVQYPFGYGLSYTTFDWELTSHTADQDTITMQVQVTNTGDVPGKDVVQAYCSAPYYADRGIEKSDTVLCAFAKTGLLQPGQSETVTLTWNIEDMASYDYQNEQAYVLDEGEYELRVCTDSHHVIATAAYTQADRVVYRTDSVTGTEITNRFDGSAGNIITLSREDWDGTWPDLDRIDHTATQEMIDTFRYQVKEDPSAVKPATGAKNGLMLSDMANLDYDDRQWDVFLDQLTVAEMCRLVAGGGYGTEGIDRLGIPCKKDMDGPAAINNVWAGTSGVQFPGEVVIGSTWNTEIASLAAACIADEALAYDVIGWYGPGANLHRSAFGGRNFEYYAEDPFLSGKMAARTVATAQDKGLVAYVKHFALNEQENNRNNNGLYTWCDEQAIRELYLPSFEIAVKEGSPTGFMSSFNRIGSVWAGGSQGLLKDILRGEWGFRGAVVSDATQGWFWPYMDQVEGVMNGNDMFLDYGANYDYFILKAAANRHPEEVVSALRTASHNILYSVANSAAMK